MKQKINYQLLAIIGVILVLNVIFSPPSVPRRLQIKEGEIATVDVIAPYDFSIPKTEQELNDERADIARRIHPTYELDNTLYPRTEKRIADLGRIVDAHKGNRLGRDSLFSILQREYRISESIIEYLRRNDHRAILRRIENTLADLYADGIVDTKPVGHSIITIMSGDQELVESVDQLYSLAEAESMAASSGKVEYRQLLASFIAPNIIFNQVKTELLINEVFANVPRTKGKILKGELIVEKHKRIPEGTLEKIFALENTFGSIGAWEIIRVVLFRNLLYFSIIFLLYHFNKITRVPLAQSRSIYYIALLSTIYLILGKIVLETDTVFLLPIAFFVFLFAVYFNLSTAIVLTIVLSGLMALMANSLSIFVYLFVSGIVGVFSSQTINSRLSLYRPLLYIAIANVVAIMFVDLYLAKTPLSFLDLGEGVLNGILVSVSVALFLPLFERLFDFTTDLTLLELGNLNLPLFKEMSIEVPGTYHHSIVVGNLAEAGASVIGADPILARVGSYYHDIGKLKKPEYFIENQIGLKNAHDKLKPQMSALIIISHVKDGIEMAKRLKLPKKLTDIVEQHHGTTTIELFYRKALNVYSDIDQDSFRYPGPKPKTKESALVMIADSVEATARSEKNITVAKLQKILKENIEKKFNDGQLDDCPITRNELAQIRTVFLPILTGVFHPRIEYDEPSK